MIQSFHDITNFTVEMKLKRKYKVNDSELTQLFDENKETISRLTNIPENHLQIISTRVSTGKNVSFETNFPEEFLDECNFMLIYGNVDGYRKRCVIQQSKIKIEANNRPSKNVLNLFWKKKTIGLILFKDHLHYFKKLFCSFSPDMLHDMTNNIHPSKFSLSVLDQERSEMSNHIYVIRQNDYFIDKNVCKEILEFFDHHEKNKQTDQFRKGNDILKLWKTENAKEMDRKLYEIFRRISLVFQNLTLLEFKRDIGYYIQRYSAHSLIHNSSSELQQNNGKFLKVKAIVQLNDNFSGGDTVFLDQNRRISLYEGDILLFPICWTHRYITLPTKGNTFKFTLETCFI